MEPGTAERTEAAGNNFTIAAVIDGIEIEGKLLDNASLRI